MCTESYRNGNRLLEIYQDRDAISPRKDRDNLSIITSFDSYRDGIADDDNLRGCSFDSWTIFQDYMIRVYDAITVVPICAWVTKNSSVYNIDPDPEIISYNKWTSAPGIMYTTKERVQELCGDDPKYYTDEFLLSAFKGELEDFNIYIAGEIFGYKLFEVETCKCCGQEIREEINSCWGFYGTDHSKSGLFDSAGWSD